MPSAINFERLANGIVLVKIDNPFATAVVSLYGGQVIQWHPKSQRSPVLWASDLAQYQPGKAIRAGIPICWPWFSAHPTEAKAPSHGYARLSDWELTSIVTDSSGATILCMSMNGSGQFNVAATLAIRISIGETLSVELTTSNTGSQPITFTEALHTYFNVSDVNQVQVYGLSSSPYVDLIDSNQIKTQSGAITFSKETGRVFLDSTADCLLLDKVLDRTIRITKSGSQSTVVWNPWLHTSTKMDDLGSEGWKTMVCVESANALKNTVTLEPDGHHTLAVNYSVMDGRPEHL